MTEWSKDLKVSQTDICRSWSNGCQKALCVTCTAEFLGLSTTPKQYRSSQYNFWGEDGTSFSGRSHAVWFQPSQLIFHANPHYAAAKGYHSIVHSEWKSLKSEKESSKWGHFINWKGQVLELLSFWSLSTLFAQFFRQHQEMNPTFLLHNKITFCARFPKNFYGRESLCLLWNTWHPCRNLNETFQKLVPCPTICDCWID